MKTLFLPCTLDGAPGTTASLRWRALWPAKYMEGADVYPNLTEYMTGYDLYIFQKAYLSERAKRFLQSLAGMGKVIAFDLCDADWLQSGRHELALLQALPLCSFAVAPTEAIAAWMRRYTPAFVIPDRLDLATLETAGRHNHTAERPTLCWFGYSHNIHAIDPLWPAIEAYGLELTLITNDMPREWANRPGVSFVRWTLDGANREIARHDVALTTPASHWKSPNRMITAWGLGLLTVGSAADLDRIVSLPPQERQEEARALCALVDAEHGAHLSAADWSELYKLYRAAAAGGAQEQTA